jgi:hypothetical protein
MQERNFMHSCSFSCDAEEKAQKSCSGCSRDETTFGITSDEDLDQRQLDKEPFDSRIITMTWKGEFARSKCIWKTGNQLSHEWALMSYSCKSQSLRRANSLSGLWKLFYGHFQPERVNLSVSWMCFRRKDANYVTWSNQACDCHRSQGCDKLLLDRKHWRPTSGEKDANPAQIHSPCP